MQSITSSMTVEKLRGIFATHGIPSVLMIMGLAWTVRSSNTSWKIMAESMSRQHYITHPQMAVLSVQCVCSRKESRKWGRLVWRQSYPGSCSSTDQPLRPQLEPENQDPAGSGASFTSQQGWAKPGQTKRAS